MRYLIKTRGNVKAHLWSDINNDTHCRLWSGNSMNSSWGISDNTYGRELCRACTANTNKEGMDRTIPVERRKTNKHPQLFSEIKSRPSEIKRDKRKASKKERRARRKEDKKARRSGLPYVKKKRIPAKAKTFAQTDDFLQSWEWRGCRYDVLLKHGRRCMCCGATPDDGVTVICVDHIKPRHTHPELALDPDNLQVLCSVCNMGKGARDTTDFRGNVIEYDFQCQLANEAKDKQ